MLLEKESAIEASEDLGDEISSNEGVFWIEEELLLRERTRRALEEGGA